MRLNSLHLWNFRQHVDTHIDFETGITGIIGPNGSGKSTLLEAIAWALYGMPAARGTRESIRSNRAKSGDAVKVELDFELGGHRYLVSRKLTSAELYLDGAAAPIATSISGVTDLIRRRLGMSRDEFFNTYFTGQKDLSVMAAMGPTERAQFLSRVLGYERLRTAQVLVRDRRSSIVAETTGLRSAMPEPETVARAFSEAEARVQSAAVIAKSSAARRTSSRTAFEAMTPRWEQMQRERDALQTLVAEIRIAEGARSSLERDTTRIEGELAEIATAREELAGLQGDLAQLAAAQAELKEQDRANNEEARRRTLADTAKGLTEELARLRDRHSKIETAPALEIEATEALSLERAALELTQGQFETGQTDWVRDKQEAETKRQALLEQLRDVEHQRNQIVELGENGMCPICARPLGTHFRDVLGVLDTQIESITVDGKYFRARMEQLEAMPAEVKALDERRRYLSDSVTKLERRLAKVQAVIPELETLTKDIVAKAKRHGVVDAELATITATYDADRHRDVRVLIERLSPLAARAAAIMAQLEREPVLLVDRDAARSSLAQADLRARELAGRREQIKFSEESFGDMREQYEQAAAELRSAELASVAADADLSAARESFEAADRIRAELARNEKHLAALVRDRRLHDELDRAFSDLRTDLNQALRPEISDLASRYIRELTDGRYSDIELDESYNVIVLEDALPKPVISGGEEDLANLVLRLAISEMIAERAGQAFSLLILDEVFGSLDDVRRHNVVDLLRRLQDRFEQVILITHIDSVREGLDRVVAVRYDEESGTSRVAMETSAGVEGPELDFQAGAAD
ncbi:MAG: SMC family ATPase [bacterium]